MTLGTDVGQSVCVEEGVDGSVRYNRVIAILGCQGKVWGGR